jgi:hypothetical protein
MVQADLPLVELVTTGRNMLMQHEGHSALWVLAEGPLPPVGRLAGKGMEPEDV